MLTLDSVTLRAPEFHLRAPLNFRLGPHEHWAVVGPNGSGKTTFVRVLAGELGIASGTMRVDFGSAAPRYEQVKLLSFRDIYGLADSKNIYYQQRWHSSEEPVPTVRELLGSADAQRAETLFRSLGAGELMDKNIILLSSGELRKFLIAKSLLTQPRLLLLDNPYIGLDAASREAFNELLARLAKAGGTQLVMALPDAGEIPDFITHVQPLSGMALLPSATRSEFAARSASARADAAPSPAGITLPEQPDASSDYELALDLRHIHVAYGARTILHDLSWQVRRGEKWALLGPNGAGKSTLLSLVCADNPQAYANTFALFGRERGTGESIWDIKQRIGYLAPELHLYYRSEQPCEAVVQSGFFDHIGLHRRCTPRQQEWAAQWMSALGIAHLAARAFARTSFGEQQLVLLARALVKNPELLILDEPMHGLDPHSKRRAMQAIEAFCARPNKTLIYVSHYASEIPRCVEKTLLVNNE